jgi:small subunit ribosomal protein S4
MSRYTGPVYKVARRLGYSITETGKELKRRPFAPGQHGKRKAKLTEYALQLREKQKVRFNYGLTEKQLRNTFDKASKQKGVTGENFLVLLETRLDNLVYRAGFASTKRQARQLVNHRHILVDGKILNIPSYTVQVGQTISMSEKAGKFDIVKENLEGTLVVPNYIDFNKETNIATLTRLPNRDEFLTDIKENLIVEFYSK